MKSLADTVDAVVGVDTHRDTHTAEIASSSGQVPATIEVRNDSDGFAELLGWIIEHSPGPQVIVAVEGTRSYGIGLSRTPICAGLIVVECEQPASKDRRGKGKSDPIDAHHAVLYALSVNPDRLSVPRADGDREALRILLGARHDLTVTRTSTVNRLRALLLDGDDTDRDLSRGHLSDATLTKIARRRVPKGASTAHSVRQQELRRLAVQLRRADGELRTNTTQLDRIVNTVAPGLTDRPGIGPVTAAQAVISYSHPGRVRHDGAFAALAGTSPLQASSGRTTRHRLNRGGDRQLNRAIHTIAVSRMRTDPETRPYTARRTAEGLSTREIRRCLKRYITREIYRHLNNVMTLPAST
jgi:transposase